MAQTVANWTVITGSTGGIGGEIARQLADQGTALILVNRSEQKAIAQRAELLARHPDLSVELVTADLMDLKQITAASETIKALPGRIDTLYNNAGVLTGEKILSAQGYESHFAINVLAAYQFTKELREKMARTSSDTPAMVVNFSSSAVNALRTLDLAHLANPESVGGLMTTYAQSKLAVTAMAAAMAEELKTDNILIRAIDPGATKSPMTTGGNSGMPVFLRWLAPLLFSPADKQAAKVISGADPAAFEGRSGIYLANIREKKMPAPAADRQTQKDLIAMLDHLLAV